MTPGDRQHRILQALGEGQLPISELKRRLRDPKVRWRSTCRARTWDAICQLADVDLVVIRAGQVLRTDAGDRVLESAERQWASEGAL